MQNEAENKQLQTALMAEGAAGLWDLTSDRKQQHQAGLTGGSLRGLMEALRKPVLSVELQLPAVCAVWHACTMSKPRERLIQVGSDMSAKSQTWVVRLCQVMRECYLHAFSLLYWPMTIHRVLTASAPTCLLAVWCCGGAAAHG